MVKMIARYTGGVDVRPTVVVIVANRYADIIAVAAHSRPFRRIGERAVMIVVVKPVLELRALFLQGGDRGTVHKVDVQKAIAIVVEQRDAANHRLRLILVGRCRVVEDEVHPSLLGNFVKNDGRSYMGFLSSRANGKHGNREVTKQREPT